MSDHDRAETGDQEQDQVDGTESPKFQPKRPFGALETGAKQQIAAQVGQRVADVKRELAGQLAETDGKIARLESMIAALVGHIQTMQTTQQVSRPAVAVAPSAESSALLELVRQGREDNRVMMAMILKGAQAQTRDPLDDAMRILSFTKMVNGAPGEAEEKGGFMKFYEDAKRSGLIKDGLAMLLASKGLLDSEALEQIEVEHDRFAATGSVEPTQPDNAAEGQNSLPAGDGSK